MSFLKHADIDWRNDHSWMIFQAQKQTRCFYYREKWCNSFSHTDPSL